MNNAEKDTLETIKLLDEVDDLIFSSKALRSEPDRLEAIRRLISRVRSRISFDPYRIAFEQIRSAVKGAEEMERGSADRPPPAGRPAGIEEE